MDGCRLCSDRVKWFWLVGKVYNLCRVRNPFEWPSPRYRTCYGVLLTHRVWSMVTPAVVTHMVIMLIWAYPCGYYRCYINYHCHILLIMALLIFLSPSYPARWDLLSTFILPIYCCVFSSRSRLRARGVRVEDVRPAAPPRSASPGRHASATASPAIARCPPPAVHRQWPLHPASAHSGRPASARVCQRSGNRTATRTRPTPINRNPIHEEVFQKFSFHPWTFHLVLFTPLSFSFWPVKVALGS
jgi:hypothetical protein